MHLQSRVLIVVVGDLNYNFYIGNLKMRLTRNKLRRMILKEIRHQIGDLPLDNPEELDFSAPGASFEEDPIDVENDLALQVRRMEKEDAREVTQMEIAQYVIDQIALGEDMTQKLKALKKLDYSDLLIKYVLEEFGEESDEFETLFALGII